MNRIGRYTLLWMAGLAAYALFASALTIVRSECVEIGPPTFKSC